MNFFQMIEWKFRYMGFEAVAFKITPLQIKSFFQKPNNNVQNIYSTVRRSNKEIKINNEWNESSRSKYTVELLNIP